MFNFDRKSFVYNIENSLIYSNEIETRLKIMNSTSIQYRPGHVVYELNVSFLLCKRRDEVFFFTVLIHFIFATQLPNDVRIIKRVFMVFFRTVRGPCGFFGTSGVIL